MHTKIILIFLYLISIFWHHYRNKGKVKLKNDVILYLLASIPVIIYSFFGGITWFYSFIGIIVWTSGFYFGESLLWWGICVLTIGSNFWYFGILGPLLITLLPRFKKFRGLLS